MKKIELSSEFLKSETDNVLAAIGSDQFISRMKKFKSAQGADRFFFADKNLNPSDLKKVGVNVPEEMRVCSRAFEEYGQDKYFDVPRGYEVAKEMVEKHPEKIDKLREESPQVYREFMDFVSKFSSESPFFPPKQPPGIPPGGLPPLPPPGGDLPPWFNPDGASACGCACGGAATVCGGAGGGAST